MSKIARVNSRPLLKWVGGKGQLLPALRRFYPDDFRSYVEPFLGSGAVFFDLWQQGALDGREAILVDANPDLIGCYQTVRDRVDDVLEALTLLAEGHQQDGAAYYYRVRDERFNPAREAARTTEGWIDYTPPLAAMFIYLNRTGFNGLFRVNARGAFNVPAGRYQRPRIVDVHRLREASRALGAPGVRLVWGQYGVVSALAAEGDFVYFDPPYAPLSATANFTNYTASGFGAAEQAALRTVVLDLASRGCHVLLSNSTAAEIAALYDDPSAQRAGLRTFTVPARRSINSNSSGRGAVDEFLITNIRPTGPAGALQHGLTPASRGPGAA